MITLTALHLADVALGAPLRRLIREELTKPGSEFHKAVEGKTNGSIAVVWEDEKCIGWARTETWYDGNGSPHDTLEAFVREEERYRGIASFAASGLNVFTDLVNVAVFHPHMLLVARRAGMRAQLFERHWVRV